MIDGTDLISLETDVRDLVGEETAKFWSQARVFRAINSEVARLARKVIDLDNGWFETTATYTPASSMLLPTNCYIVRNVESYENGAWYGLRWVNATQRGQYQTIGGSTSYPQAVRFEDGYIYLEGGTSGSSSIKVYYARMPAEMRYETLASGGATTGVMSSASVIDDVYNGDKFIVLSGSGVGRICTVTDYTGSSYTMTFATGTALGATSVIAWLLPDPLDKYADVVAMGAAIRLLHRRRDSELINTLMGQYAADVQDMMSSLGQRQTDQPQRVNYLPDGLEE